jgi:ABC-type branched-subunit amino acid transport system ATPase component
VNGANAQPAPILSVEGISKSFVLPVLNNVSLSVPSGGVVGLIGPNGSGKSTLFNVITGFERPDSGSVRLKGERIDRLLPHAIAERGLMRTFQLSQGGLKLTAIENLMVSAPDHEEHRLFANLVNPRRVTRRERALVERAAEILALLGLTNVANEYLGNLSGGQRKLIDIGRMLMARPAICLFDEPTAGVNPVLIGVILSALRTMNEEHGFTIFLIEHNMRVVNELSGFVYVLSAGQLIAAGTPEEVRADDRVIASYMGHAHATQPPRRVTSGLK